MAAANLIDGRAIADKVHEETRQSIAILKQNGIQPGLAFVRVGEDPASKVYVGMKERACAQLQIQSRTHILPEEASEKELLQLILRLNADPGVHGILVQAPLPKHIRASTVHAAVSPGKDVDGFHPVNMGKLLLGDTSGFVPCTPAGVQMLLAHSDTCVNGANVVVLGRGNIVGKPLAALLAQKAPHANATVTLCHSGTRDLAAHCRQADILVAAIGSPHFVKREMVKPGAVVIDVGVNRVENGSPGNGSKLVGDVDFDAVQTVAGKITPNPGGVGPMTIAMLLRNTARAAAEAHGIQL